MTISGVEGEWGIHTDAYLAMRRKTGVMSGNFLVIDFFERLGSPRHPDRRGLLYGLRLDCDVVEIVIPPVITDVVVLPQRQNRLDQLIHPPAALVPRDIHRRKFAVVPAHRKPAYGAAAGQHIEGRPLLGVVNRIAEWQRNSKRPELYGPCHPGQRAHQHHRLQPRAHGRRRNGKQVIDAGRRVETQIFRPTQIIAHFLQGGGLRTEGEAGYA